MDLGLTGALALLGGLLIMAVVSVRSSSPLPAWTLAVLSAAWFPVDNGTLEGPVLVTVDSGHGLTLMDLVGVGGLLLALVRLRRTSVRAQSRDWSMWRWSVPTVLGLAAVALAGVVGAYFRQSF